MRRKKNKQMEGQMSIFDMFSSVIENTKTEEENVTVSEGGIAAADITAVETGTQTSIFDLFSTDEHDTQKQEKKPKKNFFHRTIQFAKSLEDKWKNNLAALKMLLGLEDYADEDQQTILSSYEGWGGLSSYFEVEEKKVQLETLVGENTYKGIKSSILTSYYTNEKIINFMYQILSEIGVKGKLNILDPCMGTGNFYRMLPDTLQDSNLYGVELEETSCNIAKQLFQKANIQNCAFEKADLPDNYFDLIIGNVPFSDFSAADNTYGSCLIHDYFFLKALDLARPGGIVAMITTKGTMDKKSSRIRKMLAKKADLLCAIRLPETAFAVTGAKVSTDILFFQKRRYQTVGDEPEWVNIAQEANMYFGTHLNHMLGRMMEESGPYGKRFVCKEKEGMDWKACIDNFHLESYLKDVYEPGQTIENNDEEYVPAVDSISNMSYGIYNNHIYYRKNSMMKKIPDTGMVAKRIAAMIELRNVLKELISKEMQDVSDESIEPYRKKLNMTYDKFQKKFGLIHSRGNKLAFQEDDSYYLLCSLENLDENNKLKSKADIFTKRTIVPHSVPDKVNIAQESLLCSLNEKGCIDFAFMESIYDKAEKDIIEELQGQIFLDPETEEYVMKDEYLSGNVRKKLEFAKCAAKQDKKYNINVAALEEAQPEPLKAAEIDAKLGATWIPAHYIEDFLVEVFDTPREYFNGNGMSVTYTKETDHWDIEWYRDSANQKAAVTYGTKRINGFLLLEKCLNLKDAKVYDTVCDENDNKKEVLNSKETTLAMGKQDEIREVFHSWIFKSYDRRCDLENIYNERFNSIRYRTFDGDFLKVPNMNSEIKLYKHQKDAIMRILFSKDNSLIGHKVGYGKTYTAIAAIMVAKRLKLSEKNLFVVPNPLVGQWGEEFMKLFPGANILVSSENDFTPAKRKEFCSKIATGSYDAIIIAQSQFQKIPISPEYQEKYIKAQIEELDKLLDSAEQNFTVRNIESSKKKLSVKLEKLQDSKRKDDVIYFDQLGVTKLIVDEAHYYKNLLLTTKMNNIAGINTSSNSKRAFDMFMKCQYMEENCRNKGIVFLTGTPVSNSMAEVYTMQRYLQLNTLKELGIDSFDSWASTFGETKTAMELAPEGTGYRARTRFTRFVGLAELLTIFKEVADIKVKDIKEMDVPNAVMETISIDASDEQKKYVDGLASRAARIRDGGVDPSEDNMLKVTNEGRKLALDQRLVGIEEENFNSKAKYCVNQVMDIYEKYPGKTQVIFLDLSTPKKGEFNVYDDVKAKLIERGIPEGEIAFIHSAKTNKQKVDLCKKVNEGVIRVLLGSTDKAGTGCNFQKKLIALHDLDCPWRPSDLTQRSGRIIRQGNFNKEVYIYRYVTKNTFDSYLWQTVENKQRYIGQILSEENIPRRMEEDDLTLSFAEIKAAACGNPLIKEQMELTQQVKRLKMQKNNFLNQYYELESYISKIAPNRIEQYKKNIENIEKDIEVAKKYHTGDFHIKVLDKYDSDTRAEANKIIRNIQPSYKNERKIASYQGFDIILDRKSVYSHQTMIIRGSYDYEFEFSGSTNIMYQIDKIIEYGILEELKTFKRRLEFESRKFVTAKTELNPDFPHESELIKKQARLSELNQKLSA